MSGFYGNGIALTEKVLDYLWGRQNITLNNIANDDTPGFKSQQVTFEDELIRKLQGAGKEMDNPLEVSRAIDGVQARLRTTWTATTWTWTRSRWNWYAPLTSISIWSVPSVMISHACAVLRRHFNGTGNGFTNRPRDREGK